MAQLNGYSSAGKTGTAWKFDEKLKRVNSAKYVSSFIGFAPAEDPEVTIAVVIDEPKVGGRNGGQVAAPVFREIAEQVLPELGVESDGSPNLSLQDTEDTPETVGNGEAPKGPQVQIASESKPEDTSGTGAKTPVRKETEATTKKTEEVIKTVKPPAVKNEVKIIPATPENLPSESKPKGQIKNKSSTEKKKEKT
jgi:hypothetical protein